MKKFFDALQTLVVTLWAGGLWMVAIAVKVLFSVLPDRVLAGQIAGHLFAAMAWVGLACATYLFIHRLSAYGAKAWRQLFLWTVLLMATAVGVGRFWVQTRLQGLKEQAAGLDVMNSPLREAFNHWHMISGSIYAGVCLLAVLLVLLNRAGK
jgi:hypothetical protein